MSSVYCHGEYRNERGSEIYFVNLVQKLPLLGLEMYSNVWRSQICSSSQTATAVVKHCDFGNYIFFTPQKVTFSRTTGT